VNAHFRRTPVVLSIFTLVGALALTGCSASVTASPDASSPSASATKDAGWFTKDVHLCFENTSGKTVYINWIQKVSTYDGSGVLPAGKKYCGEGEQPKAQVSYANGFTANLEGRNFPLYQPLLNVTGVIPLSIGEYGKCSHPGCDGVIYYDVYSTDDYAVGDMHDINVEGHHFLNKRDADNDWINFSVNIVS
jgi:hypothetical protein